MNNQLALSREEVERRLDAVADPLTARVCSLQDAFRGSASMRPARFRSRSRPPPTPSIAIARCAIPAEKAARDAPGAVSVLAVLTAHEPTTEPASSGGVSRIAR